MTSVEFGVQSITQRNEYRMHKVRHTARQKPEFLPGFTILLPSVLNRNSDFNLKGARMGRKQFHRMHIHSSACLYTQHTQTQTQTAMLRHEVLLHCKPTCARSVDTQYRNRSKGRAVAGRGETRVEKTVHLKAAFSRSGLSF
jgi:hypothetical protein